ncbi:C2 domain protein [Teladorsagia circumcincta]|uniref:C2 domain protein n=1 Tax=Teladorsagia circumcincta TaxID=45464 RepID=A0A2G9UMN2_TELCI|nr:C2 domain protein [Teladorsagia circumcincta]
MVSQSFSNFRIRVSYHFAAVSDLISSGKNALYVEALYTITHKVGKEECESRENLYKYVRSAFQGDTQLHNALMEKAKQNKPPVVLLNVLLLEAKDLIAKDINGFSDPFTMMGVVPGKRERAEVIEPSEEEGVKSPRNQLKRDSVLHRFGGSFRRKVGKKGSKICFVE